jgi:alpha-beta hydrolase superfamily lysophospholipase
VKTFLSGLFRLTLRVVLALVLIVFTIMLVRAFDARRQPDLQAWHINRFDMEFRADRETGATWDDYLLQEAAVFEELESEVVTDRGDRASRYNRSSRFYPGGFRHDWNHSFEMAPAEPWAAIVLVHGLTDSPYSVRALAEMFRDLGVYVVAPRMPGHGLAPAALIEVTRADWLAVVRLAVERAREAVGPDAPLIVGGYSNGGALVTKYTLDALEDPDLMVPDQVYLFSPAIGITAFARFASWHRLLASIPYFEKFRWDSILPEYDPYKYNSFPKIAGHESWMLARDLHAQLARLQADGRLASMPPLLCFQSLADATVLTEAIVTQLFDRLMAPQSELVLFDVNRLDSLGDFLGTRYPQMLERMVADRSRAYTLTVLSNLAPDSEDVVAWSRLPGGAESFHEPLGLRWPKQVYSMSHVAVPFPEDDPVYGIGTDGQYTLGNLNPKGEREVLTLPLTQFTRLRYNPFFPYIKARIQDFIEPLRRSAGRAE